MKNGPLLWSYLKIIRFFYRHFDYKISLFVFFYSDFTNNTNFGVMNSERMPAKICKFVETFLPVDLYSSPTSKNLTMWINGKTCCGKVLYWYWDDLFSNSYFAVSTKDRLVDWGCTIFPKYASETFRKVIRALMVWLFSFIYRRYRLPIWSTPPEDG